MVYLLPFKVTLKNSEESFNGLSLKAFAILSYISR